LNSQAALRVGAITNLQRSTRKSALQRESDRHAELK
jgi:hypothetical protein